MTGKNGGGGGGGGMDVTGRNFEWVSGKHSGFVCQGASGEVGLVKLDGGRNILCEEPDGGDSWFRPINMTTTGKRVDVTHHAIGAVDAGEVVAEHLLRPPTHCMIGTGIFQHFFNCAAVANPEERGAPEVDTEKSKSPAAS
jgi:hypothetical protein